MPITKNKQEIRLKSGDNFKIYLNSAWITLGHIIMGNVVRSQTTEDVVLADSNSFAKRTVTKVQLKIQLAQVAKEILDTLDTVFQVPVKCYYYNGKENSKHQELFFPEVEFAANMDWKMDGKTHQIIDIEGSVLPQSTNVACTPNSDLPSDKYATGASPVSGTNPYYLILETAAA